MLVLKQYQERALEALRYYLQMTGKVGDADNAFYAATKDLTGQGVPYRTVPQLPGLPYVCLRIPTGGGKTVMACHAVQAATQDFLRADRSVVLWLVPTDAIKEQTLGALRDRSHPYRMVLDNAFMGNITVLDLSEAQYVTRADLDGSTCIIVSTLAALRVEKTEGRKIYETAGALQHHFSGLSAQLEAVLERSEDGTIPYSLANVLRLRRPIVIMDEAHNARTPLSFDTLARFNPACILEFTATPETEHRPESGYFASNVLWHVSAAELKAESMIKLPIQLKTMTAWKEAVGEAIKLRAQLAFAARVEEKSTGEYIRPLVLLQAQPKYKDRDSLTVDVIRKALLDDFGVVDEQVAVATGDRDEIGGVDLFDRACPIRYIITVQALKEGWDCSFAYVLCSVAEQTSRTAVEQILGRVMRLPNARPKQQAALNEAYAVVASPHFTEAAQSLTDALVHSGFERFEAANSIQKATQITLPPGPLFARAAEPVQEQPKLEKLDPTVRDKVIYDPNEGLLYFTGIMTDTEKASLEQCFETPAAYVAVKRLFEHSRQTTPVTGDQPKLTPKPEEPFVVPQLAIRVNGLLELLEESRFLSARWNLSECDHQLTQEEYSAKGPTAHEGQIDITTQGKIQVKFVETLHKQMELVLDDQGWTVERLVNWLDRQIPHPDVTLTQATLFLHKLVTTLITERGLTLEQLVHSKFRLREAAMTKIDQHRQAARTRAYQALLGSESVEVDPACSFTYPKNYPANWYYEGSYQFQRHHYKLVGELRSDGEELECAKLIDTLPHVKRWVRNLERRPLESFWLQTATDRFYPDFVAELDDGSLLVVEYKGRHLWDTADSDEKRRLGKLWADRSKGKALFVMVHDKNMVEVLNGLAG